MVKNRLSHPPNPDASRRFLSQSHPPARAAFFYRPSPPIALQSISGDALLTKRVLASSVRLLRCCPGTGASWRTGVGRVRSSAGASWRTEVGWMRSLGFLTILLVFPFIFLLSLLVVPSVAAADTRLTH